MWRFTGIFLELFPCTKNFDPQISRYFQVAMRGFARDIMILFEPFATLQKQPGLYQ
jgi:hypothetical protein